MATDSSLMEISRTLIAKNEKKEKLIELILSRVMLAKAELKRNTIVRFRSRTHFTGTCIQGGKLHLRVDSSHAS